MKLNKLCTISVNKKVMTWGCIFAMSAPVYASTDSSLGSYFDDLGYSSNVTNPSSYKAQAASYYNGGSLYVRNPIKNAQLAAVTLPAISAGCGGIDAFVGGFSHINSDEIVALGKSIIANTLPFAVDLALQTWAPQIKVIRDQLQAVADKYLNQSINSCETAQAAVGGLAAFAGAQTRQHVCATLGTQTNAFADWVAAKHECGVGGKAPNMMVAASSDSTYKDIIKVNRNIVWSAAMNNAWLSSDTELAEFLMSISGSYIFDSDGNPKFIPSRLVDNDNMVEALLKGGKINIYKCDDTDADKCLNLSDQEITITAANALEQRVYEKLVDLDAAVGSDTALTDEQKSFIEYTSFPILKIITTARLDNRQADFADYSKMVAAELLTRYLNNMLNVVVASINNTNTDPQDLEKIEESVVQAKNYASQYEARARELINQKEQLIAEQRRKEAIIKRSISVKTQRNIQFGGA